MLVSWPLICLQITCKCGRRVLKWPFTAGDSKFKVTIRASSTVYMTINRDFTINRYMTINRYITINRYLNTVNNKTNLTVISFYLFSFRNYYPKK